MAIASWLSNLCKIFSILINLRNSLKLLKGITSSSSSSSSSIHLTHIGSGVLMFWCLNSILSIYEYYFEFLFHWFPFYYIFKSIFIILITFPRLKFTHNAFFNFLIPFFEWLHIHYYNLSEFNWIIFFITLPINFLLILFPFHIELSSSQSPSSISSSPSSSSSPALSSSLNKVNFENINEINENIDTSFDLSIPIYDEESNENNNINNNNNNNDNDLNLESILLSSDAKNDTNSSRSFENIPTGITLRKRNKNSHKDYENDRDSYDSEVISSAPVDSKKSSRTRKLKENELKVENEVISPLLNGVRQVHYYYLYYYFFYRFI